MQCFDLWDVPQGMYPGGGPLLCDQAAQDTCPIRTSAPQMPHNQHQGWLLLTEAEMEQDPIGSW